MLETLGAQHKGKGRSTKKPKRKKKKGQSHSLTTGTHKHTHTYIQIGKTDKTKKTGGKKGRSHTPHILMKANVYDGSEVRRARDRPRSGQGLVRG